MREVIYILCPGHSGSTLLGLLIASHPRVATVGELKRAPAAWQANELCSCGETMQQCRFWQQIQAELLSHGPGLDDPAFCTHYADRKALPLKLAAGQLRSAPVEWVRERALQSWAPARSALEHLLECNRRIIDAICQTQDRPVFLDTSKDASRLRYLLHDRTLRLRVVHLVRDGRAVACSLIRKGYSPEQAAREWVMEHTQALRLAERLEPDQCMRLRYEDFCCEAGPWLDRVLRFAGLEPLAALPDWWNREFHVIGNRLRLRRDTTIRLDESWRHKLTSPQLRQIEPIVRPLNTAFGYGPTDP